VICAPVSSLSSQLRHVGFEAPRGVENLFLSLIFPPPLDTPLSLSARDTSLNARPAEAAPTSLSDRCGQPVDGARHVDRPAVA